MRVIVTGATGFIGAAVLKQCVEDTRISSILILSRKAPIAELSENAKVRVILHEDFLSYPPQLMDNLEGAEGCIWCLGGKVEDFPNLETARKVGIDYTLAGANAFAQRFAKEPGMGQKFPFVFCSGNGAEWDQDASLWLFSATRKLKGAVEKGLFDISRANPDFDALVLRPGGVLPDDSSLAYTVASVVIPTVLVSGLAKALVQACVAQPEDKIIENRDIVRMAGHV